MMITKVRSLGLGLFPAAKEVPVDDPPPAIDAQRDGMNGHGFEPPRPNRNPRPPQPSEIFEDEPRPVPDRRAPRESAEPEPISAFIKSARKSYAIELFEAALREKSQKPQSQWDEGTDFESQNATEKVVRNEKRAGSLRRPVSSYGSSEADHEIRKCGSNTASRKPYESRRKPDVLRERTGSRNTCDTEPLMESESEYYEEEFPEELCERSGERFFKDKDRIKLVQKNEKFRTMRRAIGADYFLIIIPELSRKQMARPPNGFGPAESVANFHIRVVMVHLSNPSAVDAAVNWLMGEEVGERCVVGMKCELGEGREVNLIALSVHRRCVLVRLVEGEGMECGSNESVFISPRLSKLLATHEVVKSGTETQDDAVGIYWATGMVVNRFQNVAQAYVVRQRPLSLTAIFRKLYKWEWNKPPDISKSDWGRPELSSKEIKFAIMSAWSARMISLEGAAAVEGALTQMSLKNIPQPVLDLFGRAISDALKTEESANDETSGTLVETSNPGTLELVQHSFRARVKSRAVVEVNLKDDQGSTQYKVSSRKGKSVTLTPYQGSRGSQSSSKVTAGVTIESIKNLTILEGAERLNNWRSKTLWEGLRGFILDPATCPQHLLLALGFRPDGANGLSTTTGQFSTTALDLRCAPFTTISRHLNDSQREAWQNILTTPLSATIGPPGTGKTSLIQSVAKSWIARRNSRDENSKEILLCSAYQNVAVRHLAETLVEGEVPGVLLLISEEYYTGWHEGFYTQLIDCLVVSSSDTAELAMGLSGWRARNEGRSIPNVIVCTVDIIGGQSFQSSRMNGKVTSLIIDESSQASDVSFLRPLIMLPDLAMVSVLGDPHQLPPYSAVRNEGVLVPSVFDLVSGNCTVNFLREQYRMPPSICQFLSAEIYDNVLMTAPHRLKEKDIRPLVWSHVKGATSITPGKTSLYNAAEALSIVRFCTTLVRTMEVAAERVVVLTLYEDQTRRIADGLATAQLEIPVHNVDSFQGQQCDIVVISLVVGRSFSAFAADQRRACVMLSRVRRLLCVFGDFDEVKRNSQAGLWMKLAIHCKKQNLVIDDDKLESFLASSVEKAKETWVPRQDKMQNMELLSRAATAAAETEAPPPGIAVHVVFKARY